MIEKYLIFLNLDGTIMNDSGYISEKTIKTLEKVNKKNKLIIYTPNSLIYLKNKLSNSVPYNYFSTFNGNFVIDNNNKIIIDNYIFDAALKEISYYCDNNNLDILYENNNGVDKKYIDSKKYYRLIVKDSNKINKIIKKYNLLVSDNKYIYPSNNIDLLNYFKSKYKNYKIMSFSNTEKDLDLLKKSDIGIKLKNSSGLGKILIETNDSINEDGVANFLINYFNLNYKYYYNKVKILDCTLRDGGHLNNCNFGKENIKNIIIKLSNSKIDYIELGFLENCIYDINVTKFNKIEEADDLLKKIDTGNVKFSLLLQVDRYDINKLSKCCGKVDMIRISFHKEYIDLAIEYINKVIELGYKCSINPINFSNYSNLEVVELLKKLNGIKYDCFTIVDTFGTLLNNDFDNKLSLLNTMLNKKIKIGLHLHDNLSSSFSTAQILIQKNTKYGEVIIDSSVNGMGRTPGNLKTELLMYYLNKHKSCKYDINYIYDLIENEMKHIKERFSWNLDFRYSMSSFEQAHRSYAEYLQKNNIDYRKSEKIIKKLNYYEKQRYNEKLIEKILKESI